MSDCIDAAVLISTLFSEMLCGNQTDRYLPIEILTDNKSLVASINSKKPAMEKRLRIDIGAVKEAIECNHISKVTWVSTKDQLANVLTKQGASTWALKQTLHKGALSF